jgi:integrase
MSVRKRSWTSPSGEAKSAWQADYTDQTGVRRRETFATKKDADAFLLKARVEIGNGVHTADRASITVADAGTRWIAHCETRGLERTTVDAYRDHVALHINPYLGNVKLSALTIPTVTEFQDALRAAGRSSAMVRKARIALGAILKFSQKRGLVAQNVVRALGRDDDQPTERHDNKRTLQIGVDIPTREEMRAVVDSVTGRYRALLVTATFTGLRASELRGLRWSDLDLKRGELHVRQRADRFGEMGPPKSKAGTRTLPLMPMVVSVLREHKLATPTNDLDLVFPNSKGKVDHLNTIAEGWQAAQIAAGVVDATGTAKYPGLHAIRHFFASWCINRRADGGLELDPKRVQGYMGHSTIVMTMDVYGHLFPHSDHAAEMADAQRRWQA